MTTRDEHLKQAERYLATGGADPMLTTLKAIAHYLAAGHAPTSTAKRTHTRPADATETRAPAKKTAAKKTAAKKAPARKK